MFHSPSLSQMYVNDIGGVGWYLVRKTPVEGSLNQTWSEQEALIGEANRVTSARVMVYSIIGHFIATGERLFNGIFLRTSSGQHGARVQVSFDSTGLQFGDFGWDDNGRFGHVGMACDRKPLIPGS